MQIALVIGHLTVHSTNVMKTSNEKLLSMIKPLLAELGDEAVDINFLTKGASCEVWRLSSENRNYALKIFLEEDRNINGEIDGFIRRKVVENGGMVIAPLLDSEITDQTLYGKRWSIETYINGYHPPRGKLPKVVCKKLGLTLAALHDIPVDKFGKPKAVSSQFVVGSKSNPFDGVAQRFENPIPETWAAQYSHPLLVEVPDLWAGILARLQEVSQQVRCDQAVVCHTDLHEKQLICEENELIALIDFGDATILDRHWDLGSVLYFHGKTNFSDVYEAYLGTGIGSQTTPETVESFSVAIAMHHASRSRLPGKTHRLAKAIQHIRDTI